MLRLTANPADSVDTLAALRRKRSDLPFEVLAPHTFFALFKQFQARQESSSQP